MLYWCRCLVADCLAWDVIVLALLRFVVAVVSVCVGLFLWFMCGFVVFDC